VQRAPGSTALVAQTVPSGSTTCGPLPSDVWSRIGLIVHTRQFPHTFDVRIDGKHTACKGVATGLSPPFNKVGVMDAANEQWGGRVYFDDIMVAAP
jgi:hypothetical protein